MFHFCWEKVVSQFPMKCARIDSPESFFGGKFFKQWALYAKGGVRRHSGDCKTSVPLLLGDVIIAPPPQKLCAAYIIMIIWHTTGYVEMIFPTSLYIICLSLRYKGICAPWPKGFNSVQSNRQLSQGEPPLRSCFLFGGDTVVQIWISEGFYVNNPQFDWGHERKGSAGL